jgi:long-chain fatty acid transport protein
MREDFAGFRFGKAVLSVLVAVSLPGSVFAAGFQIQEQNVANMGLSYAGSGSMAQDASTAFYNAAGLTRLKQQELSLSSIAIQSSAELTATSAKNNLGTSVSPLNSDNPGAFIPVPAFHYAAPLTEDLVFGLSIAIPFGLASKYSDSSPARYVATTSSLMAIDVSPSLAYRLFPELSIGAGPNIQKGFVTLDNAVGVGAGDGFLTNKLKGYAYGYHVGVLYEPMPTARVGLHYRSKMKYNATGDATLSVVPGYSATVVKGTVNGALTLPEAVLLSAYYEMMPNFAVTADIHWTKWSRFDKLVLNYSGALFNTLGTKTVPENFKDTVRYSLGAIYNFNQAWNYSAGIAFDPTPTRDEFRTARVPDEDRVWLSAGSKYAYNKQLSFDLAYAHLFFKKAQVNDNGSLGSATRMSGSYKSYANLFGLQVNWKFD